MTSAANLRQQAANAAARRLRDAHLDEYREYLDAEAQKRGVVVSTRPTPEEKAQKELAELLAKNPSLKTQLAKEVLDSQKESAVAEPDEYAPEPEEGDAPSTF